MKVWHGYGSEHSANLVMIGRFKDAGDATKALEVIKRITSQVADDSGAGRMEIGSGSDRYTGEMQELLRETQLYTIGPAEIEQFGYDFSPGVEGDRLSISTDEYDVSAFLKLLVEKGARVEVYSRHDYPEDGVDTG